MKKNFLLLILLIGFLGTFQFSYADDSIKNKYEIITNTYDNKADEIDYDNIESIIESDKVKIFKIDNKYAVYDKENNSILIEPIINEIKAFNEKEYKIKSGKLVGYLNIENKTNFLTEYNDIILFNKYLKTKKNNKYGLIDKEANLILKPIYEKIGIFYNENEEYISAKYDGKYKLYKNTGKLIPEEDLYVISNDGYYLLAQNLKPELKKYRHNNAMIYQKESPNIDKMAYDIEEINIPENIKTASISKDVVNNSETQLVNNGDLYTVDNIQYMLVKENNNYGLSTKKGDILIPAIYEEIIPVKPCKHYKKPIFITIRNGIYSEYNSSGRLLAEQVYDKINFYKYGKVYTYTKENNIWTLRCNGKLIGNLLYENNTYTFSKQKFHLFGVHKINELFISILENTK